MDEYFETKKKLEKQKIEIQNLISKFKELKSLVYNYKDEKEKEILKLSDNQTKLEFEIQNQKNNYENQINTATKEIENFIQASIKLFIMLLLASPIQHSFNFEILFFLIS